MMRKTKFAVRFLILTVLLCLVFSYTGCSLVYDIIDQMPETYYEKRGLENFNQYASPYSICTHLFPKELEEEFKYIEGDYWYIFDQNPLRTLERAMVYFQYDAETYEQAKQAVLGNTWVVGDGLYKRDENNSVYGENVRILSDVVAEYNGYVFHEIDGSTHRYYDFQRFGYNDDKQTLVFLGFYANVRRVKDVKDNFGALLEKFYSEFYDFSE